MYVSATGTGSLLCMTNHGRVGRKAHLGHRAPVQHDGPQKTPGWGRRATQAIPLLGRFLNREEVTPPQFFTVPAPWQGRTHDDASSS